MSGVAVRALVIVAPAPQPMPVDQPCLPTLDLPRARFAATLPGEHILATRIAAGTRLGCWVLSNPADPDWAAGQTLHFSTELDATDWREDLIGRLAPGEPIPPLLVDQAAWPCFALACAGCGDELGAETTATRAVHPSTLAGLEDDARSRSWSTTTGRDWSCPRCSISERTRR